MSMAVLLILFTFILNEMNVNSGFKRSDDIYRIIRSDNDCRIPTAVLNDAKGKIPEIEKLCPYDIGRNNYKIGIQNVKAKFLSTNDDFLEIFSLHFIYKGSNPTLSVKENIILTKEFSEKLFGSVNPVGKTLEINDETSNIVGVVENMPENSSFRFEVLRSIQQLKNWREFNSFVRLFPNTDSKIVNNKISGMLIQEGEFKNVNLSLQPLKEVYFNPLLFDGLEHANVKMIILLFSVAVIILVMAVFNYVNLVIADGYERLKEIGIKKINGANSNDIFKQVLTESLLVSLVSLVLSTFTALIISPLFSSILDKSIEIKSLFSQPLLILSGALLFTVIGLISGLYPALKFSAISPLKLLSHQKVYKQNKKMGSVIIIQFMITLTLIISLLFIRKQVEFVKHRDLGFDREMLLRIDFQAPRSQLELLKTKLLNHPGIISVSITEGSPMDVNVEIQGTRIKENEPRAGVLGIDENFIKTFGIKLIKGRNITFSDTACLINEHLYKELEWNDLTGKKLFNKLKVVGVVKDFNYNAYSEIKNLILGNIASSSKWNTKVNIKINGNIAENLNIIKTAYHEIEPDVPISFKFYDDWIQTMYQKEEKQESAIKVFAFIAIMISCLGLIGLAEHITRKKVKEIGIRKVNGAKISEILIFLNGDFIKWVIIAFIIACPLSWYAMHKWLQDFAYKTELSWWIFALAGFLALLIAILTVSWQCWKAATRNPVEALRYE